MDDNWACYSIDIMVIAHTLRRGASILSQQDVFACLEQILDRISSAGMKPGATPKGRYTLRYIKQMIIGSLRYAIKDNDKSELQTCFNCDAAMGNL